MDFCSTILDSRTSVAHISLARSLALPPSLAHAPLARSLVRSLDRLLCARILMLAATAAAWWRSRSLFQSRSVRSSWHVLTRSHFLFRMRRRRRRRDLFPMRCASSSAREQRRQRPRSRPAIRARDSDYDGWAAVVLRAHCDRSCHAIAVASAAFPTQRSRRLVDWVPAPQRRAFIQSFLIIAFDSRDHFKDAQTGHTTISVRCTFRSGVCAEHHRAFGHARASRTMHTQPLVESVHILRALDAATNSWCMRGERNVSCN